MIFRKAELSKKLFSTSLSILTLMLAIACGGGGSVTNSGIQQILITGDIDDATVPTGISKPRRAPGTLTGKVYNLNSSDEIWEFTPSSNNQTFNYEVYVTRKTDIKIVIYSDQQPILSRVLSADETNFAQTSGNINTATHFQAKLTEFFMEQLSSQSFEASREDANLQLFGSTSVSESEYKLEKVNQNSPDLAVIMSTYGQLLQFVNFSDIEEALALINTSFDNNGSNAIKTAFIDHLNSLTSDNLTLISSIVSAHETAKNITTNPVDPLSYVSIANDFNSVSLNNAHSDVKVAQRFLL